MCWRMLLTTSGPFWGRAYATRHISIDGFLVFQPIPVVLRDILGTMKRK